MPFGSVFVRRIAAAICMVLPWLTGCAAFHPLNGVPARYLPADLKAARRSGQRIIDLSLLNQRWDGVHRVDSGDVLGIYIGGVLGKIDENPQVQFPQNSEYMPAAGVPVTVREDGTVSLPMIGSLTVRGLTTRETEEAIRQAYTNHAVGKEFLPPGRERILVSLMRPRQIRVLVVRQDSRMEPTANAMVGMVNLGTTKRGSGKAVNLPAYKNDVLNALIATDGLPGLDAENAVYIIRRDPNIPGGDHSLPPPFDPEQLIRQNKRNQNSIIRGQSPDYGNYRSQNGQSGFSSGGSPYGDYRQGGSPMMSNQAGVSSQYPAYANPQPQSPTWNQQGYATGVRQNLVPFNGTASQGYADTSNMSPVQSAGLAAPAPINGARPWAGTSSPNGYAPMNLTPTPDPNSYPAYSSSPPNTGYSQSEGTPPTGNQPNFGMSPSGPFAPFGGSNLPNQGYALPEPVTPGFQPTPIDGPGIPLGGYHDAYPTPTMAGSSGIAIADGRRIIRIPIRLRPDEQIDIKNEDVILNEGDIVFIESRDAEVFFTGGLLGGGQYTLPRDEDLDILKAISIATSRLGSSGGMRSIGGVSALNSDVTISPSTVIVLRKLPEGGEIPIKINLYQARNDLAERIFIQPGDYIYLEYTPLEAVAAFIDRHLIEGALFGLIAQQATTGNTKN